jgi:hypothetical protein
MQAIRVFANQLTHVLTAGAVAALDDLFIHEGFERVGEGYIHGAHEAILDFLAKFGKTESSQPRLFDYVQQRWRGLLIRRNGVTGISLKEPQLAN